MSVKRINYLTFEAESPQRFMQESDARYFLPLQLGQPIVGQELDGDGNRPGQDGKRPMALDEDTTRTTAACSRYTQRWLYDIMSTWRHHISP